MVKLSILYLSLFCTACGIQGQQPHETHASGDIGQITNAGSGACHDKKFVDSLINCYILAANSPSRGNYNDPRWLDGCDSVLAICPDAAEAYQLKAVPSLKSGDYETAFRLNNEATRLDPMNFLDYRGFLRCIFTKDFDGALVDLTGAEKLKPRGGLMDHTYSFFMGLCLMELGRYSEAEDKLGKDLGQQAADNPDGTAHFNSLFYMGLLKYRMGKSAEAKSYFEKTLTIYNQHPEANYYLALTLKEQGNGTMSKQHLGVARTSLVKGFRLNEDNIYYANYPGQITLYEIEKELNP